MRRAPSRASSSSVSQVSPACRGGVSMASLSMGGVSFPPPPAGCLRVGSRGRIRRLFSSPQVTPSTTFENNSLVCEEANPPDLRTAAGERGYIAPDFLGHRFGVEEGVQRRLEAC